MRKRGEISGEEGCEEERIRAVRKAGKREGEAGKA